MSGAYAAWQPKDFNEVTPKSFVLMPGFHPILLVKMVYLSTAQRGGVPVLLPRELVY
jgi:hypothetical protein